MKQRTAFIGAVVAVALVAIMLVLASITKPEESGTPRESSPSTSAGNAPAVPERGQGSGIPRRTPDDPLALGDVDAPVVLIEYADFRCPFCAVFARDTMPALQEYVDDGTLRIEWRDFPIFGDQSFDAAVAARAAGEQDRFWEFHEALYADAPDRGHPELPPEQLLEYAEQAGVPDLEQFERDLDDPALAKSVRVDRKEAIALGMTGTPGFVIGNQIIVGAQPESVFVEQIEKLTTQ